MGIQIQRFVHPAFQSILNHEIDSPNFGQDKASDQGRITRPEQNLDPFNGDLFEEQREQLRTIGNNADVGSVSFVTSAAVREAMEWK